jgi:hypothetical protein
MRRRPAERDGARKSEIVLDIELSLAYLVRQHFYQFGAGAGRHK